MLKQCMNFSTSVDLFLLAHQESMGEVMIWNCIVFVSSIVTAQSITYMPLVHAMTALRLMYML